MPETGSFWGPLVKDFLKKGEKWKNTQEQNCELQNAMTSERGWILTFRKKPLFPLMEIFDISSKWFFIRPILENIQPIFITEYFIPPIFFFINKSIRPMNQLNRCHLLFLQNFVNKFFKIDVTCFYHPHQKLLAHTILFVASFPSLLR